MRAEDELRRIIDRDEEAAPAALLASFDALAPVDTAALRGDWAGGAIRTGHPGEAQLAALGWVGKRFHGDDDVDPIVVRGADGGRVVSPVMGKASLRMVVFRGAATATMIYDRHPILDHFRRVDEDTLLGVMDRKGEPAPLFFHLRRLRG
jgi:hypothetical protein